MKFVCALIVVKDIQKSRKFYEEVLGQTVKYDFGENVTFEGDFSIHQEKHFESLIQGASITKKSNNFELYFEEDDLETVAQKIEENGLEFIHGIDEQPWKQKVLRFYDFDENLIEVGERMEHVAYRLYKDGCAIEEICKTTYLDAKTVNQAIRFYEH